MFTKNELIFLSLALTLVAVTMIGMGCMMGVI
jgi:hypothetical protein